MELMVVSHASQWGQGMGPFALGSTSWCHHVLAGGETKAESFQPSGSQVVQNKAGEPEDAWPRAVLILASISLALTPSRSQQSTLHT